MKTLLTVWMFAAVCAASVRAAEGKAVKLAEVPVDIRDKAKSKSNGGMPTFYKQSGGFWAADCERDGKPIRLVIATEENVVDGKTNVVVTRIDAVARKLK